MNDLISRKALLAEYDRVHVGEPGGARKLIEEAPAVQRWIPESERLPDEKELVLILCKNGAMFVGYCGMQYADFERRWRIKTALNSTKLLNLGRVTHWMPLPEPPKGE